MMRPVLRHLSVLFDGFTLLLIGTVGLAALLPVHGAGAVAVDRALVVAIAWLFFLHGARLSRQAILAGLMNWRLHVLVSASTFVLFPLLGLSLTPLEPLLGAPLLLGFIYLSALPSTVQSSIAFTSIGHGNVPAAVASASLSNLAGVFVTPLLVGLLLAGSGDGIAIPLSAVGEIVLQILVPFVAGHLLRPWVGDWVMRHGRVLRWTDQGTILLVVYAAFSESVAADLWRDVPASQLGLAFGVSLLLLAAVLVLTTQAARRLGFDRADEVTIVFCGSKKSLATGVPMAKILFAGNPALGLIVLPLMVFHQLQLMACAVLARRYARRAGEA